MKNNVEAIFLDLDGTTLNSSQSVSGANIAAIKKALDSGIDVYLVSGRPLFFVKQIANIIDSRCLMVGFNGAYYIVDDIKYKKPIGNKELEILFDKLCEYKIDKYYIKGETSLYCSDDDNRFTYNDLRSKDLIQVLTNINVLNIITDDIFKVLVIDQNDEKLQAFSKECSQYLSVTSSHKLSLDIMEKSVDKGNAIDNIVSIKNYTKEKLMAIGDGRNDALMLQHAEFSIAMENGDEVLKKSANYVTLSNDNDGVAHAIKKFCF